MIHRSVGYRAPFVVRRLPTPKSNRVLKHDSPDLDFHQAWIEEQEHANLLSGSPHLSAPAVISAYGFRHVAGVLPLT
jgi:hypothetical protein